MHAGVGLVVLLMTVYAAADLVAWNPVEAAGRVTGTLASATHPTRVIAENSAAPEIQANSVETTEPADPALTTAAVATESGEPVATFTQGYAGRQATRTAATPAPQSRVQPLAMHPGLASAKQTARRQQMSTRVYKLADGRRIRVHRQYGNARADARSAEIGPDRFGRRSGDRQGFFSASGRPGLY
jgi:hypothetical protein